MKLLGVDGTLYKFISRVWDLIKLNFAWLLCSIPLITFGGATVAAFDVASRMAADEEGDILKDFIKSFRSNFKSSIVHGLLFLFGTYCLYIDWQITVNVQEHEGVLLALTIIASVAYFVYFAFSFVIRARYVTPLIMAFKNSKRICIKFFGRTVLMLIVIALVCLVFQWNTLMIFIGFLLAPALIIYVISAFAIIFFREIDEENKSGDADRELAAGKRSTGCEKKES